jgi:hypothetical protein
LVKQWRLAMPKVVIHYGWLAVMAVVAQLLVIYLDFGDADVLRRFIFPSSYVLLLAFVALNRRYIGFLVIGAGMLLNLLAIVSNGGLMPVSPANMAEAGLSHKIEELSLGDGIPRSKNVLLEDGDTHLRWLSDRFTWLPDGPFAVFSAGDVIIVAGLLVLLFEFLLPRVQRVSPDRTSPT